MECNTPANTALRLWLFPPLLCLQIYIKSDKFRAKCKKNYTKKLPNDLKPLESNIFICCNFLCH